MKYSREYSQLLASEGFPAEWVKEAITYRELKKCIKRVSQELQTLGLDAHTLNNVPAVFGVSEPPPPSEDETLATPSPGRRTSFVPELWIAVDKESGAFVDAGLTKNTKDHFSRINGRVVVGDDTATEDLDARLERRPSLASQIRWVNIPLSTATSFFNQLDPMRDRLDTLRQQEEKRLEGTIVRLGNSIEQLTHPIEKRGKYKSQTDTDTWREILALYIDSAVFFSSYERDHGSRSFGKAKTQLESFSNTLVKQGLADKFKSPQSRATFEQFVTLNLDILRAMRFQEINHEAVRKLLKKFDKRTALSAAQAYQGITLSGSFAKSIATDMCAAISSKVVAVVPQMDDFICPICCGLAWRPIRLGCCNSIYCIRCVIQLQKDSKDRCPMCREPSIMRATGANIDDDTAAYLLKYFPKEVKERQKANERAAAIDQYGERFYRHTCAMM